MGREVEGGGVTTRAGGAVAVRGGATDVVAATRRTSVAVAAGVVGCVAAGAGARSKRSKASSRGVFRGVATVCATLELASTITYCSCSGAAAATSLAVDTAGGDGVAV